MIFYTKHFRHKAMTLVEVALSLGILTFCVIALMGLLPVMFKTTASAREQALSTRIHQAMAVELKENPPTGATSYWFNKEGLRLPDGETGDLRVDVKPPEPAVLANAKNAEVQVFEMTLNDVIRDQVYLTRPIFVAHVPQS